MKSQIKLNSEIGTVQYVFYFLGNKRIRLATKIFCFEIV
jgi:hypothetical protein